MPGIILAHPRSNVTLDPPSDPREQSVLVRALTGDIAPDTCCACGCHIELRPLQTSFPMGVLYGDNHLAVTRAISYALEYECGPAVQILMEALGSDERLMVARQLSRTAVSEHLKEMAK